MDLPPQNQPRSTALLTAGSPGLPPPPGMEGMLKAASPRTQGTPRSHPHLKPRPRCFPKAPHP